MCRKSHRKLKGGDGKMKGRRECSLAEVLGTDPAGGCGPTGRTPPCAPSCGPVLWPPGKLTAPAGLLVCLLWPAWWDIQNHTVSRWESQGEGGMCAMEKTRVLQMRLTSQPPGPALETASVAYDSLDAAVTRLQWASSSAAWRPCQKSRISVSTGPWICIY